MIVVYDIETLASLFTYTYLNTKTEEIGTFIIHKDLNEIHKLYDHLDICSKQIGFNNINFDYPIIHNILLNRNKYLKLSAEEVIDNIYQKAQEIISNQNSGDFSRSSTIPNKEILIDQLDLFRIWHYNNKARKLNTAA